MLNDLNIQTKGDKYLKNNIIISFIINEKFNFLSIFPKK
jgi:hypothetical protein